MDDLYQLDKLIDNDGPLTFTLITTYRCTAACKQCCFESNPKIKTRLSFEQIKQNILNAYHSYPNLQVIVFSGGECFMLGQDLYKAIALATGLGLKTRCVSNGYWAKSRSKANKTVSYLIDAGLTEINLSTGMDHQQWVSKDTILNAAEALIAANIRTLITVERDSKDSHFLAELTQDPRYRVIIANSSLLSIQTNSWMPFQKEHIARDASVSAIPKSKGCEQVFKNSVVTPHNLLSACCGLTMEHIPEMKLGDLNKDDIKSCYDKQKNDFIKLWLSVDGPFRIIEKLMGKDYLQKNYGTVEHPCHACVYLHKDRAIIDEAKKTAPTHIVQLVKKLHLEKTISLITKESKQ